jgi:aminopeptidase N
MLCSWLNEGWTMYLERRIQAGIHGDAEFDFSAIIGWESLRKLAYSSSMTFVSDQLFRELH